MKHTEYVDSSWDEIFKNFTIDLDALYTEDKIIFPKHKHDIFKAFSIPISEIKVVILGQDCYINEEINKITNELESQAHGLSFSVPDGIKIPPSLRNIFKEIKAEFPSRNYDFRNGNLQRWVGEEKIFLLNCSLTVEKGKSGSHMKIWKDFTDSVIKKLSKENTKCIFVLFGNFAKAKESLIENKERIITAVHPSPLSASRGFFGSNVFKEIENKLGKEVDWQN